ncbi:hypothetical protein [Natrialba swarupiae]|uniref:Uncharacterized protein n=1 Tax=Natrialba swarupiae TaxID=2448032 RepID=A0A5D5AMP4_9EURY|nr:hypothetical protein [Natrialba swarupiae]TYT62936.1 hypothetical protein FYC77_06385 [Natrialba swarupiae]
MTVDVRRPISGPRPPVGRGVLVDGVGATRVRERVARIDRTRFAVDVLARFQDGDRRPEQDAPFFVPAVLSPVGGLSALVAGDVRGVDAARPDLPFRPDRLHGVARGRRGLPADDQPDEKQESADPRVTEKSRHEQHGDEDPTPQQRESSVVREAAKPFPCARTSTWPCHRRVTRYDRPARDNSSDDDLTGSPSPVSRAYRVEP